MRTAAKSTVLGVILAAGLAFPSKAVTEQIRAVDKRRLVKKLGHLAPDLLAQVEQALKNTLALP